MKGRHKYFRYYEDRYGEIPYHNYIRHCGDAVQMEDAISDMIRFGYLTRDTNLKIDPVFGLVDRKNNKPFTGEITLPIIQTNVNKRDKKALVALYGSNWKSGICMAIYTLTPINRVYLKDFGMVQVFPDGDNGAVIIRVYGAKRYYDYYLAYLKISTSYVLFEEVKQNDENRS